MLIYRKLENTITGSVDGKPFSVAKTEETLKALSTFKEEDSSAEEVLAYVEGSRGTIIAGTNEYLSYNPSTKEYFLELGDKRSKHPIIPALVKYIEDSYDMDIDFMPVLKAWARLLSNPRYNEVMGNYFDTYINAKFVDRELAEKIVAEDGYTQEAAKELATFDDIAITDEGLLATYKVAEQVTWEYVMEEDEYGNWTKVKKDLPKHAPVVDSVTGEILEEAKLPEADFKEDMVFTPAIWSGGHKFFSGSQLGYVYKVGEMQYLPEEAPRNLSNSFGGGGLYIGGQSYIDCYRQCGTHVLTCFVNPSDILSFQSEGSAIRVDALFPNNILDSDIELRGKYHSSDYGKLSEERLKELMKKAIDKKAEVISKLEDELEDLIDD